ncbi:hypothetical protein GCM10018952_09030 [Streptosporangium vulgare]
MPPSASSVCLDGSGNRARKVSAGQGEAPDEAGTHRIGALPEAWGETLPAREMLSAEGFQRPEGRDGGMEIPALRWVRASM